MLVGRHHYDNDRLTPILNDTVLLTACKLTLWDYPFYSLLILCAAEVDWKIKREALLKAKARFMVLSFNLPLL